jgi:predicted secreted protein
MQGRRQHQESQMKQIRIAGLVLLGTLLHGAASAQEEPRYNRVDLMASASMDVENDLLIAIVFAEVEDNDQADAADAVNRAISWAAERADAVSSIEAQTTNYNTRPVYANGRRIVGWVARQSLRLESQDAEALSELLGELQQRVAIQSINYGISRAARDAAEDELIAEALARFSRRASLVARELGQDGYRIVHINVGTAGGFRPQEAMMRTMAVADVAAPTIEAGTQTMSVTINGTVELDAGD